MNTKRYLSDLAVGDSFVLVGGPSTVMTVQGIGTLNNLTRVTYSTDSEWPRMSTFTAVSLTSIEVVR